MGERTGDGWAWPANSRKAHYFATDGRSRCGRWAVLFGVEPSEPGTREVDDCAACWKVLEREAAKAPR